MSGVVTVRVPEELKEDLKKYNVELAEVARRAWEEAVREKKLEAARVAAEKLGKIFSEIGTVEIVRTIREDREKR